MTTGQRESPGETQSSKTANANANAIAQAAIAKAMKSSKDEVAADLVAV